MTLTKTVTTEKWVVTDRISGVTVFTKSGVDMSEFTYEAHSIDRVLEIARTHPNVIGFRTNFFYELEQVTEEIEEFYV
jgi:hypothetical protein